MTTLTKERIEELMDWLKSAEGDGYDYVQDGRAMDDLMCLLDENFALLSATPMLAEGHSREEKPATVSAQHKTAILMLQEGAYFYHTEADRVRKDEALSADYKKREREIDAAIEVLKKPAPEHETTLVAVPSEKPAKTPSPSPEWDDVSKMQTMTMKIQPAPDAERAERLSRKTTPAEEALGHFEIMSHAQHPADREGIGCDACEKIRALLLSPPAQSKCGRCPFGSMLKEYQEDDGVEVEDNPNKEKK